ncbi:Lrp/AsnC family transcriptional regulator [Candidatus Bathyarchaeota archaeon]|nr:Lrp/AsnC family transcriptional regulator [Candidatus Bathyarchaeota archaeon]
MMYKHRNDSLDELDNRILALLSEDARKSCRELAEKLDVASGTVYNRVRRMTEAGVIKGYIPLLNHTKLGYGLMSLILIQVEGQRLTEVEKELAKHAEVMAVYDITGEFDVAVVARFKSQASMNDFIKDTLKIPSIRRTVTNVVLNVVKEDPRVQF